MKRSICQRFETAIRGNSMQRVRIEGPITHRNLLVGWEPMEIELAGKRVFWGFWDVGSTNPRSICRKPIGRLGTNGNRARWRSVILGCLDARNMNPSLNTSKTRWPTYERVEISFVGNMFFWDIPKRAKQSQSLIDRWSSVPQSLKYPSQS